MFHRTVAFTFRVKKSLSTTLTAKGKPSQAKMPQTAFFHAPFLRYSSSASAKEPEVVSLGLRACAVQMPEAVRVVWWFGGRMARGD